MLITGELTELVNTEIMELKKMNETEFVSVIDIQRTLEIFEDLNEIVDTVRLNIHYDKSM